LCLAEEERERGWFLSGGGDCCGSCQVQPAQHIHLLPLLNQLGKRGTESGERAMPVVATAAAAATPPLSSSKR